MTNLKSEIDHWNKVFNMIENNSAKRTTLVGTYSLQVGVKCEFCTNNAIKTLDMNSFQVNLCEKCINLVKFVLRIIG